MMNGLLEAHGAVAADDQVMTLSRPLMTADEELLTVGLLLPLLLPPRLALCLRAPHPRVVSQPQPAQLDLAIGW